MEGSRSEEEEAEGSRGKEEEASGGEEEEGEHAVSVGGGWGSGAVLAILYEECGSLQGFNTLLGEGLVPVDAVLAYCAHMHNSGQAHKTIDR